MRSFLFCLFFTQFVVAQSLEFTNKISENKITSYNNQKLIVIDFWATWCGPCVAASKQLEIFQENNQDKVFIFSVSDQSESVVKKFLERNPINLMVVLDTDKKYFDKYNVVSRPYSVLLDLDGNLIWKGHPADLNQKTFDKFYEKNKNSKSVDFSDLVKFKSNDDKKEVERDFVSFEIKKINEVDDFFEIENNKVTFSGKMAKLIAILNQKSINGIEIENSLNYNVQLVCDTNDWNNPLELQTKIADKFDFVINEIEKVQFGNELIVEDKKLLWNTNEIVWEDNPVNFLIGSEKITANDVSLKEFARILSEAKNKNYVYSGNDANLYDWEFQIVYDELMVEELKSTFGIKIKPHNFSQKITRITKN